MRRFNGISLGILILGLLSLKIVYVYAIDTYPKGKAMADKTFWPSVGSAAITCKSPQWLDDNGVSYTLRDIKEENPTAEELVEWHKLSGLSIRKFFNTSGMVIS